MQFDLDHALRYLVASEGSDLHLKVPSRPLVRVSGQLEPMPDSEPLRPVDTAMALEHMLEDAHKREEFEQEHEVDFSYGVDGLGRFRVNAFKQQIGRAHV